MTTEELRKEIADDLKVVNGKLDDILREASIRAQSVAVLEEQMKTAQKDIARVDNRTLAAMSVVVVAAFASAWAYATGKH